MTGEARAWGWVAHLAAGGTTPWRAWSGEAEVRSPRIPGAQHLELLRRLNLVEPASGELAQLVLRTNVPGRGQLDLDLVGVVDGDGFGALPVDPADIPVEELERVASGALADLTLLATPPAPRVPRRTRFRRTHYRLAGDPLLVRSFRRQLRLQGRPPGGRDPEVVVLLSDYGTLLGDAWAVRARRGRGPTWQQWLGRLARAGGLPPRLDVLAQADEWAARVGPGRVHLVFDVTDAGLLLGTPGLRSPRRLSHAALEAVRLTSTALRVVVDDDRREGLLGRVLVPWLRGSGADALPAPALPRWHRGWVGAEAARVRDGLLAAGYPVHGGSLDRLLPAEPVRTTGPEDGEVLDAMLQALHVGHRAVRAELEKGGAS